MLAALRSKSLRNSRCALLKRTFSTKDDPAHEDLYRKDRLSAMVGHNFPDFIEYWNRDTFRQVGYGLAASTVAIAMGSMVHEDTCHTKVLPEVE